MRPRFRVLSQQEQARVGICRQDPITFDGVQVLCHGGDDSIGRLLAHDVSVERADHRNESMKEASASTPDIGIALYKLARMPPTERWPFKLSS